MGDSVRLRFLCVAVCFAGMTSGLARAQDTAPATPTRVVLRPPACTIQFLSSEEFLRILRIELTGDGVATLDVIANGAEVAPMVDGTSLATISIDATPCEASAHVFTVTIDDAVTRKSVRRTLDLADTAESARPRAFALAVAELLRASWAELVLPDSPQAMWPVPESLRPSMLARMRDVEEPAAVVAPPPRQPTRPVPIPQVAHTASWDLSVEARLFPSDARGVLGARTGVLLPIASTPLHVRLDAGFGTSVSHEPEGDIRTTLVTGGAGLYLTAGRSAFFLDLGPRVELGWGSEKGIPSADGIVGGSGSSFLALLGAAATLRVRVSGSLYSVAGIDVGAVLYGLEANVDGVVRSAIAGEYISARVGFAYSF